MPRLQPEMLEIGDEHRSPDRAERVEITVAWPVPILETDTEFETGIGRADKGVLVDAEHVVPEPGERFGDRAAEPAEADHDNAVAAGGRGSSQRWGAPPDSGMASACCAVRGRSPR